jgi:hypothetical protein
VARKNAIQKENAGKKVAIKFFDYRDKMYIENKSLSTSQASISNKY